VISRMKNYVTKAERVRRKHWNRKMWRRCKADWEEALSPVTNQYLKVKVACVVMWDSQDDKLKQGRDFSYLKSLSDNYRPYYEEGYNQEELKDILINLGYPKDHAIKRSTPPKGADYEQYRRLKKKQEAQL